MATEDLGLEHWKKKYYDQLDRLDQKEKEWGNLESVLKRAIGRLSLAAEGNNASLDRHVRDLRAAVKDKINLHRLEGILDDLSAMLAKVEEKKSSPDSQSVDLLQSLLEKLELPASFNRAKNKLSKRLAKATDRDSDELLKDLVSLIKNVISEATSESDKKPGLLDRILGSTTDADKTAQISTTASVIVHIVKLLPWPEDFKEDLQKLVSQAEQGQSEQSISNSLGQLEKLIDRWKKLEPTAAESKAEPVDKNVRLDDFIKSLNKKINWPAEKQNDVQQFESRLSIEPELVESLIEEYAVLLKFPAEPELMQQAAPTTGTEVDLETYRQCVLTFLDKLDDAESPNGRIAAFKLLAKDANEHTQLDKLSGELAALLAQQPEAKTEIDIQSQLELAEEKAHPSIQELLIRLLEQLVVPVDLHDQVNEMKHRLEKETEPSDWKQLLKDVAVLINSIRSRMQKEKHEFEDFLQQITSRLKEMDTFLQVESSNLKIAEQEGKAFDIKVKSNVQDIRDDVTAAADLDSMKNMVESRLDEISRHIKEYRQAEQKRFKDAEENVDSMRERMVSLEQETENLKHIIVEKNKEAMFDALTGIPNRLSYEKKVNEEIARWKRFGNPLSLAIWDVDLFKKVNDTYGHAAGDKVLKTIAKVLHDRIRATDFFARYGGEEFVMLLPGTKEEETLRLVNALREKVEACGFHYHGEAVKITVSCGVSSFQEGDSLEKVFERADQALYKAKQNGRNQCVVASCLSD